MKSDPWYQDGLRFECTQCGGCCTGFPGTVRVTAVEIDILSRRLGLSEDEFRKGYTRSVGADELSLREKPNLDCVFYGGDAGCQVYEDRPKQCRTWPFWRRVVRSATTWETEAASCPGMDIGRLYDAESIRYLSEDDGTDLTFEEKEKGDESCRN